MSTVLRMVGKELRPGKEEEIKLWWTTHHIPLILTGQAVAGEGYQRIGEDKTYPQYLVMYEFESEKALNDYLKSPLYTEVAQQDASRAGWRQRGDATDVWKFNYRLIAKRGENDRSLAFNMVATNLPRGATESEFNEWYNYDHMTSILRSPEVIRVERYERIGDDEAIPRYLCIHRYPNEKAIAERRDGWLGKLGIPERRQVYPDGVWWDGTWRASYKLISKERKDNWIYL